MLIKFLLTNIYKCYSEFPQNQITFSIGHVKVKCLKSVKLNLVSINLTMKIIPFKHTHQPKIKLTNKITITKK